ncbi:MAG: glutaredoxin 3 [SAR116 cluster bacterium]|nr:glutaredoxin 3 [SAR116 cluster bacterium]
MNKLKVIIYTTKTCGYCILAKNLLKKYNIKYNEIDVSEDIETKKEMVIKSLGKKTVPQIFFGQNHVGGFFELNQLHLNGDLIKN